MGLFEVHTHLSSKGTLCSIATWDLNWPHTPIYCYRFFQHWRKERGRREEKTLGCSELKSKQLIIGDQLVLGSKLKELRYYNTPYSPQLSLVPVALSLEVHSPFIEKKIHQRSLEKKNNTSFSIIIVSNWLLWQMTGIGTAERTKMIVYKDKNLCGQFVVKSQRNFMGYFVVTVHIAIYKIDWSSSAPK